MMSMSATDEESSDDPTMISRSLGKRKKTLKKYLGRRLGTQIFSLHGQQCNQIITLIDILLNAIKKESRPCLAPSHWALLSQITTTIEEGEKFWKKNESAPAEIMSALLAWTSGEGKTSEACASTPSRK